MAGRKCSCASFERLEGASVPAYIAAFLERQADAANLYRCRVCGGVWEKRAPEGAGARPSLVRRK